MEIIKKSGNGENWVFSKRSDSSVFFRRERQKQGKDDWFIIFHDRNRPLKTIEQLEDAIKFEMEVSPLGWNWQFL
jgi:hypothetical protein